MKETKPTETSSLAATEGEISRRAWTLWDAAGRPTGRDLEFWLAAEAQLITPTPKIPAAWSSPGPAAAASKPATTPFRRPRGPSATQPPGQTARSQNPTGPAWLFSN